jgi:hypothetical protein
MAKALFGHVGGTPDPLLVAEVRGLRRRVRELESELARARAINAQLTTRIDVTDDLLALEAEPALT